jgi:hypothetical protein
MAETETLSLTEFDLPSPTAFGVGQVVPRTGPDRSRERPVPLQSGQAGARVGTPVGRCTLRIEHAGISRLRSTATCWLS